MSIERTLSVQPLIFVPRIHPSDDTDSERELPANISAHSSVLELEIESKIERRDSKLFAAVKVISKVAKGDLITFSGICKEIEFFDLEQRCPGWSIKSVNGNTTFDLTIADPTFHIQVDGRGVYTYFPTGSRLVSSYQIVGVRDRFGDSDKSVITTIFKPVELLLQQYAQEGYPTELGQNRAELA